MDMIRLKDAADQLSVSYPTLKQWIYKGKIRSVQTPGGHHRIPRSEVDRLTGVSSPRKSKKSSPNGMELISARNKLLGQVIDVKFDGLLAQVTLDVGGQQITSIITRAACQELGLRIGSRAFALIKSTEVMVIRG